MISFYPGPSKFYPEIGKYLQDAFESDLLSANHRSNEFMEICRETIDLLHEKLNIPPGYSIVFVSSATECWEIIAQSFTEKASFHFFTGAFGEKWMEYAKKIKPETTGVLGGIEHALFTLSEKLSQENEFFLNEEADVICLTQNETSNGSQIDNEALLRFREKFPEKIIAVDATSSLGGIDLKIENADIWFASVQKCLGLPAGLGLFVASPKAIEKAKKVNDHTYYNSFLFMNENIQKFQTHYTPNVLAIYLLKRVMEQVKSSIEIGVKTQARAKVWYSFFEKHPVFSNLIHTPSLRSDTVICVSADEKIIAETKQKAKEAGIVLGNGYGKWKNTTFRIANFPQIEDWEIEKLISVLSDLK